MGSLPHLSVDRLQRQELLGGVDGTLPQRPQVRQRPLLPLLLVPFRARRVEPAPELTRAPKLLYFSANKNKVDMRLALQPRRDIHHSVLDIPVALPRLYSMANCSLGANIQYGTANGSVDVLRRLRLARLGQLQLQKRRELSRIVDRDNDLAELKRRHLWRHNLIKLVR